jgi:hypothetical protein
VGNLPWEVDGYELKQLFSKYGEVVHAKVIYYHGLRARPRRRSRGFSFVMMATQEGSEDAICGRGSLTVRLSGAARGTRQEHQSTYDMV